MTSVPPIALAFAIAFAGLASGAHAAEVTLRLKGGGYEITGTLKAIDGGKFVIETRSLGTVNLDQERFECVGEGCAAARVETVATAAGGPVAIAAIATVPPASTAVHGSPAIGATLMPALIRAHAERLGGRVTVIAGVNPREVRFRISDARGKEIAAIDLHRYGTASAFTGLEKRVAAIAMADRPIDPEEADRIATGGGSPIDARSEHVLALDGLAVIVAPENPLQSVSVASLARIFAGEITDWSELGLPAGRIAPYALPASSGSSGLFYDRILKPAGVALGAGIHHVETEAELADAVATDPGAIGFTSFGQLRNARAVRLQTACGLVAEPTAFTIKSEEYPLWRRLYLYSGASIADPSARALLQFALSREAQPVIAASGFVDQSIEALAFGGQEGRAAHALAAPGAAFDLAVMRQLLADMRGARRLSVTYRFRSGSIDLDSKAQQDIGRFVQHLATPGLKGRNVLLLGFSDNAGPFAGNAALSLRRAAQVRLALLSAAGRGGLDSRRLVAKGYGPLAPVACNDDADSQEKNRRVEVWVRE